MKSGTRTWNPLLRAMSSAMTRVLTRFQPKASEMMTTIGFGANEVGGSATYVLRPWSTVVLPLGVPSWMVPVKQLGHDIVDSIA
jgi:uncharacterized protein (UPF0261 family)